MLVGTRSLAYFAAAAQYQYGHLALADTIFARVVQKFIQPGRNLHHLRACGGEAEVLAFAGITIDMLLTHRLLEEAIFGLQLTWRRLVMLSFRPEDLRDARFPLIALYDLGMRGKDLVGFRRTIAHLKACLSPTAAALLRINLAYWE